MLGAEAFKIKVLKHESREERAKKRIGGQDSLASGKSGAQLG